MEKSNARGQRSRMRLTATQVAYQAAGYDVKPAEQRCWLCGGEAFDPQPRRAWEKSTFTNHDLVGAWDSDVVCAACAWSLDESSHELARRVGKEKPQRMRNYSHFVISPNTWTPLSKADKSWIAIRLSADPFPRVAVVADSGQKHLMFRARVNPEGAHAGWVQFEEDQVFVSRAELRTLLGRVEDLYTTFSKTEIETGRYAQNRIQQFGIDRWREAERIMYRHRGSPLLRLALFLAQKREEPSDE